MKSLKTHAKYILAVLTAAYVTAFTVTQILSGKHMEVVSRVDMAGILANSAPIAAIDARVLEAARVGAVNVNVASVQEEILREAGTLEAVGRNLYLGRGELKPPGKHVKLRFEEKTFQVEQWIESEPARFVMETTSLWDALKLYYQNCRRVVHDVADDVDMRGKREWRYIIRNGVKRMSAAMNDLLDQQTREADDDTVFVKNILVSGLCILLMIFTVILAHFWRLLRKVSDERLGLYTVFVSIPRPIVIKLATKKITTGADSDSDSDDDDDNYPGNNGDAAAPITAFMINAEVQQQHRARHQYVDHNNSIIVGSELLPVSAHVETSGGNNTPAVVHGILAKNSGAPWTSPWRGGSKFSAVDAGGRLPGRASMDDIRSAPQPSVDSGPRRASVDSAYGNRGGFVTKATSDGQQGRGRGAGAGAGGEGIYGKPDAGGAHRMHKMQPMSSSSLMMTALARSDDHPSEGHAQVMPGISGRFFSAASSMIGFFRQATRSKVAPELLRAQGVHRVGELQTSSVNKFAKTGRKLDPAGSQLNVFAIPILLWGVLVILSFTLSYLQFQEIDAPMRSLGVAARVEVLASTARFYANDLVLAGAPGHVPLGDRSAEEELVYLRGRLNNVTVDMYSLYESLLLGGGPYGLKGSLYDSPAHTPLLFDHGCLRLQGEHHAPPCVDFADDYYYRTMSGLDNLVKHFREECLLLALEPDSSLTVNNTRFSFIWVAGKYDLRGGLKQNTQLFMDRVKGPPRRDRVIQICVLLCVLFSQAYFVRYMFLPWTKRTQMESHRISELLAQLPAEIDMHAIVTEMLLKSNGRNEDEDYVDLQD